MSLYARVPKDPVENLKFRRFILAQAKNSPAKQAALREACSKDVLFWVNAFCFTVDPRLKADKKVPFLTYPYQDTGLLQLKSAVEDGEDVVIQKSRVMGASWMLVTLFLWFCLFRKDCKFLMMSRTAEFVDSTDSDSLFWKLDKLHELMPSWMLDIQKDIHRVTMKVNYLQTGCQITGATTTKSSGIGGRATAVGIDEYSRYDPVVAALLKSGLRPVTNCCLWNFTPNPEMGKAHPSYDLVKQVDKGDIGSLRMHWREHPVYIRGLYRVDRQTGALEIKDEKYDFGPKFPFQFDRVFEWHSPWFDKERKRVGNDRDMKELYEIDYEGSGFTFFDEMIISEYISQHMEPPRIEGDLIYDELTGEPKNFVVQSGGRMKLWLDLDRDRKPAPVFYTAGADISLGVGTTPSCLSVGNFETGEKVLEFATADMPPDKFAAICVAILRWFSSVHHQVYFAWERQGPGDTFAEHVIRLRYTSVYIPPANETKYSKKPGETPGFHPGVVNNRSLLLLYQSALANRHFLNHSHEALKECFQWMNTPKGPRSRQTMNKSDDPSGATENHGDRVIADALCYKMMVVKGGGSARTEEAEQAKLIVPGTLAYEFQQDERMQKQKHVLFPNWSRRHGR